MASKPDKIELFIGSVRQLFNSFDPSPFLERDLDAEAERYIVAWAAELDARKPIVLLVHFSGSPEDSPDSNLIPGALRNYFGYRANQAKLEIHELLRIGWRSMVIGLLVLMVSLTVSNHVTRSMDGSPFGPLLAESFIILGWVANWRPLEIFLYDWWPIARKRKLYLRLARASVEILYKQGDLASSSAVAADAQVGTR
jgi:hypothetical protein